MAKRMSREGGGVDVRGARCVWGRTRAFRSAAKACRDVRHCFRKISPAARILNHYHLAPLRRPAHPLPQWLQKSGRYSPSSCPRRCPP